ncbi:MAG TPA: acyltransferase [Asticcacaulis sp.]|nr:acyltransferase [Asticcacaulis sp.]
MRDDNGLLGKQHFKALDACRGLCAVMVVLFHISANGYFYDWTPIRNGGRAVSFFFVLSGFVITYAYSGRLRATGDLPDFMIRRFGRIYPLHLFTLALLVLIELTKLALSLVAHVQSGQAAFSGSNDLWSLLGNLFLLNGVGLFSDFTWNGPSWSISTEFYTYIVFAVVAVGFRKKAPYVLAPLALLFSGLLLWADSVHLGTTAGLGFLSCLYCFSLGSLTYSAFSFARQHWSPPAWAGTVALIGIGAAFFAAFPLRFLLMPLAFAACIFVLAFETGAAAHLLGRPLPQFFGRISYSIYLMQYVILQVFLGVARVLQSKFHIHIFDTVHGVIMVDFPLKITNDLFAIVYVGVVVAASALSYKWVEEPARDYFNGLARKLAGKVKESALS